MSEMLYLQTERNIKITSPVVTLGDVAQLSCSDGAVLARNQVRRVAHLPDDGYGRYVCSASTLVRLVTEAEEHVDVTHIGEPNFILTYEDPRQKNTWISWCKTILVGILTFIGTAFSIMTFHTDIGIRELFLDVYTRFLPQMTPGFSVLEISYSIGIGLGLAVIVQRIAIVAIGQGNLQAVGSQRQNVQLTTLRANPSIGTKHIYVDVNHFIRLVNRKLTGFIGHGTVFGNTMNIHRTVLLELHITIVLSVSITYPAIIRTHLPMNLLFNVGLSVGNCAPVVRNTPLRERSFKHVLLTLSLIHI